VSERASETIRREIRDHGPITFAEYMDLALYGPGGYYERPPVGPAGDFVTSPHVHPVFGAMLGGAARKLFEALGRPTPLRIVEVGAGDGTLAVQLLGALADLSVDYVAVDISPGARSALGAIDGLRVAADVTEEPHVVVANELLDNLPFRRLRGDREIRVGLEGERLVEVETAWPGEPGPTNEETIVPVGTLAFIDRLAGTLGHGYALLIDYGAVGSSGGDVHGYRNHRVVDDMLTDPGSTDITSGVDFALVARRAEEHGLVAFPSVSQRDALLALGFEAWNRGELERQVSLLDTRQGLEAVRAWSARSRATLLVDPAALGRMRWLLLATPGLPPPPWLP
jgi:NADH dehydrogenase [ubiquinone] 1 alpha subcomplex assembly factor 7